MTSDNIYFIQTVAEDLTFLINDWDETIDEPSLRRSSNVLRMLLVEDYFSKAWRMLDFEKQPRVYAPDLEKTLGDIYHDKITFAQAGGAKSNDIEIQSILQTDYAMSPEEIKERAKRGPMALRSKFYLSNFRESTCIIFNGREINRRELVKYIANKLGGAHIDTERNLDKEVEQKFSELDKIIQQIHTADKSAIYFELLSIGQAIANSEDTKRFLQKV